MAEELRTRAKPDLIVDSGDLPATARELCGLLAYSGRFFDRGVPVKVVNHASGAAPMALPLTPTRIVVEAHDVCRPVQHTGDALTLSNRLARMCLEMLGEWNLPPLAGVCTAPLLSADGRVRIATGYDPVTHLWCANLPALRVPDHPIRAEAEAGLRLLRETFRTFPFADAERRIEPDVGIEVVLSDRAQTKAHFWSAF